MASSIAIRSRSGSSSSPNSARLPKVACITMRDLGNMNRRTFLRGASLTTLSLAVVPALAAQRTGPRIKPFELDENGILELQTAMKAGRDSAVSLTRKYLQRIDAIDANGPHLNSVIEVNPDA